jgi:hypothetical protein
VRAGISVFARVGERETREMARRLRTDLESGAWQACNAALLRLTEIDLGYRLVVAEGEG